MKKIILASQSSARKIILSSLGIPFEIIPSNIDEKSIRDEDLSFRAKKLARAKALKISKNTDGIIISADTFSEIEGRVLEKPENLEEAREMLSFASEKSGVNYTGFCYIDEEHNINYSTVVTTKYVFRKLYFLEIDEYIKTFPVTEWAAGFALIEPYINTFIAKIEGSFTALAYGLPTEILIPLLKKSGFEPKPNKILKLV